MFWRKIFRRAKGLDVPGDGHNLVPGPDALHIIPGSNGHTAINLKSERFRQMKVFEITARSREPRGEHYIAQTIQSITPGPYTLSAYTRRADRPTTEPDSLDLSTGQSLLLQVQMHDEMELGAIVQYALTTENAVIQSGGKSVHASIKPVGSGWDHLTLTVKLKGSSLTWIVQLLNQYGESAFTEGGECVDFAGLLIERGISASEVPERG